MYRISTFLFISTVNHVLTHRSMNAVTVHPLDFEMACSHHKYDLIMDKIPVKYLNQEIILIIDPIIQLSTSTD